MHQSWPGTRRRRDSQPSIHLPFDVYLPGMKIAGSGLTQVGFRREEIVVGRDRAPANSRRRQIGEVDKLMPGCHRSPLCPLFLLKPALSRHVVRKIAHPSRAGVAPRRSSRSPRPDGGHRVRRRLRHILYGRRQSRRAADRHDEKYRVRAGGARRRRRARGVRHDPRPAFHQPQSETGARHRRSHRSRLEPHRRRRARARPGVRPPRPRSAHRPRRHRSRWRDG